MLKVIAVVLLLSSCSTVSKLQEDNKGIGAIHVKSGLLTGIFTSEATGCITLEGEDKNTCVISMLFDSETQTCSIEMGPCAE